MIEGNHIREHVAPWELLAQEGPDKAGYLLQFSKKHLIQLIGCLIRCSEVAISDRQVGKSLYSRKFDVGVNAPLRGGCHARGKQVQGGIWGGVKP